MNTKSLPIDYPSFLKLKRARKPIIIPGTIFYFSLTPGIFMWGKVMRVLIREELLVYLYKYETEDTDSIPELKYEDLVIPPLYLYSSFWTGGDFVTKAYLPLSKEEEGRIHCMAYPSYRGEEIDSQGYFMDINKMRVPGFEDEYNKVIIDKKFIEQSKYIGRSALINTLGIVEETMESLAEIKSGKTFLIEPDSFIDNSTLTFPKQTKEIKTKEPTQIQIKIKIKDLNNPNMDMLTLEELFEDIITKKPFTGNYDELNQDPLIVILETTNTKKAIEIIKEIMDKASFINPTINKKEKLFKDYTVEVIED